MTGTSGLRIGLDVGGTKTDAVLVDDIGVVLARRREATGWGPDAVVRTILRVVRALTTEAGIAPSAVRSIGIGMPGQVEPGTGRIRHAVNLGVAHLDLRAQVGVVLGVPVRAENDVRAAAFGAQALRAGLRPSSAPASLAYLNLGTGVAAGLVTDGELWRGANGAAGEIGHISVDPAGPLCRCGQRGCIEALAGGGAIAARWGRASALPVLDVFDAADAGDPVALALRHGLAHGVSAAVRVLILTADADTVVLGGGLTALGERLRSDVVAALEDSAAASAFLRSLHLADRLELLPADSPAAALGAALVGTRGEPERGRREELVRG
ncbi:ROK family protein [Microbacterium sp. NPDC077184]|uniref:ROK family protein n=1 Tax=Microbacterium sp. NPDC077184 TaxID=3154764 RepID=UPI00344965FB